jgi:hypothetical protein
MTKAQRLAGASFREFKVAALDTLVKREQESKRALLESKMARLKALRLARDAAEPADVSPKTKSAALKE